MAYTEVYTDIHSPSGWLTRTDFLSSATNRYTDPVKYVNMYEMDWLCILLTLFLAPRTEFSLSNMLTYYQFITKLRR